MNIDDIVVEERMRKDLGDIDALAKSIEENGIISPILIDKDKFQLIAGGRRLAALKKLGLTDLKEGEHFIFRSGIWDDEYRKTAIELEENIRRKSLTWVEEVQGKQKLLEIYQRIYGPPAVGGLSRGERVGMKPLGFGVRKLSDLLGESATNTSEDLELAALVKQIPALAQQPTKEAARRTLGLAVKIMTGQSGAPVAQPLSYRIIIICDNEQHQQLLLTQLRTAGLKCQPIVA